jgi:putative aldouronate transport system permease protein
MASLGFVFLLVFNYAPMFGIALAFKKGDYVIDIKDAIFNSDNAGLENFAKFLTDPEFKDVVINTLGMNVLSLIITFPAPIIFALLINEVKNKAFKRVTQTVSYFPFFLSWIVFGGIILNMLDSQTGIVNDILVSLKLVEEPINFGKSEYFWGLIIVTGLIKGVGWGSIIYLAAIAGIDKSMYEAADIDGANRWSKMLFITLPSILPTITVYLILAVSGILNSGFDQIWIFRNQMNLDRSEVIDTYVYQYGILKKRHSYATAIGLVKSLVAFVLLIFSNTLSKKLTGRGIY